MYKNFGSLDTMSLFYINFACTNTTFTEVSQVNKYQLACL